jgi:hypothetical protein
MFTNTVGVVERILQALIIACADLRTNLNRRDRASGMLHADVYQKLIYDGTFSARDDWDNLSGIQIDFAAAKVVEACLQTPSAWLNEYCKHSSLHAQTSAQTSTGTQSGWITSRVNKLLRAFQSSCHEVQYIFD